MTFHLTLLLSLEPIPVFGSPGVVDVAAAVVVLEVVVGVVVVVVVVGVVAAHVGPEIVLASNVTVPAACAKTRPFKVAPVCKAVTPLSAKIFPMNEVVVLRVAELPILHHTLQASPPVTDEPGDVMSVDTVLKIQTPEPVRFRFPLSEKLLVEQ